jgi:hypothetical protein
MPQADNDQGHRQNRQELSAWHNLFAHETATDPVLSDVMVVPKARDDRSMSWRESNPRAHSRNFQVAQRLWNMLQDVGVSWEWTDDTNRQPMAPGKEEPAGVITTWPLLSADLRQERPGSFLHPGAWRSHSCGLAEPSGRWNSRQQLRPWNTWLTVCDDVPGDWWAGVKNPEDK